MSKQEHDQDEPRAPSGAGKGETPGDAPKTPAKDEPSAASSDADPQKTPSDDKSAASSDKSVTGKRDGDKESADRPVDSDKSTTRDKPRSTDKPASADKPEKENKPTGSKPGQQAAPAQSDKPQGGAKPAASGSATTAAGAGGAASTPTARTATAGGGKGGGGTTGIVALVLVVLLALVVAIGGWWAWQKITAQQAQLSQLSQIESNANAIADIESQLGQRDQQREQALQAMRDEMQQYREEVNQTLDRVLEQLASEQETDPSEWLYAEVEYLLRLANQRLQLERDVDGATSLLRTADERLAQADNPALTPVRRAIQSELGELQSVPSVDRTGLYLQLMAQQEQLAKLPLAQDIEQIAAEGGDTSPVSGAWQEQLSRLGQELKELVVVRRHDQALEALITPEQESYLRQNVRLQLEQAQLALLQANPELYRASLEKAITLIEGYYDTDGDGVQKSLETLRSLADRTIRPELPDISGSLQALRDFMARRQDGGSAGE